MGRPLPALIVAAVALSCGPGSGHDPGQGSGSGQVPEADGPPQTIEGLVEALGGPEGRLETWSYAELDGAEPPELVVRVLVPGQEGTWEQRTAVYGRGGSGSGSGSGSAGPDFRIVAPPDGHVVEIARTVRGDYRDRGHLRVVDLDRDGRDELLLVGATSGDSPSELSVLSLEDGGLREHVWNATLGVEYEPWDVDGDGRLEIVALGRAFDPGRVESPVRVEVLTMRDGRYRRALDPPGPATFLAALTAHVLSAAPVARPQHLVFLLLEALDRYELSLPSSPSLTAALRRRASEGDASAWLAALARVDGGAVLVVARADAEDRLPLEAAARELMTHDREIPALLVLFESHLRRGRTSSLARGVIGGARPNEERPFRILAEVAIDPDVPIENRRHILEALGPHAPSLAPTIVDLLESPTMRRTAAEVLRRATDPDVAARFPIERLQPFAEDPDTQVRQAILEHIGRRRGQATPILLDALTRPADRETAVRALATSGHCPERPDPLFVELLPEVVRELNGLHQLIACAADPRAMVSGIDGIESRHHLSRYLRVLPRLRSRHGEAGALYLFTRSLQPLMSSEDAWLAADVLRALPDLAIPEAEAEIRQRFDGSERPPIQTAAAVALGQIEGGDATLAAWLDEHSTDGNLEQIRAGVIEGLGHAGTEVARRALKGELVQGMRRASLATNALVADASPESLAILERAYERVESGSNDSCSTRTELLDARLQHRASASAASEQNQALVADLIDTSERCRDEVWMGRAIGQIVENRGRSFRPWLESLQQTHPAPTVRGRAEAALRSLRTPDPGQP